MKQYAILCIAVMMLLMSCKKNLPFLTSSNLPGTIISLDANSGYTLQTPKGAIIKIDSGSFDLPANAKLTLEVKEAYSEKDILLAGLTTVSDGRLLESGGMIYFNATADGKPVSILKPIHISIPTKKYNANMQLFKGQVAKDSSINWVNPQPLDSVTNTTPNGVAPSDSTKIDTVMEGDYPMDSASADAPCGYEYDTLYTPIPDTMTVIPAATVANNTVQAPYVPPASV